MPNIEELLINFAIYEDGNDYHGHADVTLPEIVNKTVSISGAGIAGDYDSVVTGHIDAMSMTMKFRNVTNTTIRLFEQRKHTIDIRGAQQSRNSADGAIKITPVKYIVHVVPKKVSLGTLAPAAIVDASNEFSVSYFAAFVDNKQVLEIDPFNFFFVVNGINYLEDVKKALGK